MKKATFLHVPKTAGTTIHKLIEDNLGPVLFYPPFTTPELVRRFGADHRVFMKRLEAAPAGKRATLLAQLQAQPAIGGHTTSVILDYLDDDRFVFTSLRNAGDRLVSWYFHYVHPDNPETMKRPYREETKDMNFDDFVRFEPIFFQNDNLMVRFFSNAPMTERVTEAHLEMAKQTLAGLDLIIFQNEFSAGVQALGEKLGWALPDKIDALKQGRSRTRLAKEFSYTRKIMQPFIQFDRELVAFAKTLPHAITESRSHVS